MVQKASTSLTDLMQKAVAREIQVSVQYMWQHVMAKGMASAEIAEAFEEVAVAEMKHVAGLYAFAKRELWSNTVYPASDGENSFVSAVGSLCVPIFPGTVPHRIWRRFCHANFRICGSRRGALCPRRCRA